LTLRRAAGGGVLFALSLGAFASAPSELVEVSATTMQPMGRSLPVIAAVSQLAPRSGFTIFDRIARAPVASIVVRPAASPAPVASRIAAPAKTKAVAGRPVAARPTPARPKPAAPPARAVAPVTSAANGFSYGYCTWWVAHKRSVPWRGNAAQWWWNARRFGFTEGVTPRAGAVMVMGTGGSAPLGHVGYVEAVNPNGSFVVSEMNWWGVPGGGWARVDYRTVTSMRGILGFIY
jgi:surface antigen